MPTSATRLLASSIELTACASCSGQPAPYCGDGEVEELVADLVRERLSRRASYQYWISPESLAELEGRIDTAAKKIQDLIDAEKLREGRASAAQQEAYRAAMAAFRDTQNSADAAGEKEKEIEAIKRERETALQAARALESGRERAVEQVIHEFQRRLNAVEEKARLAWVHENNVAQEKAQRDAKAAYENAWPVKDREASSRAYAVAAEERDQAKSALAQVEEAVAEKAFGDVLAADVELDDIIMVERVEKARWSLCEATATVELDTRPQGSVAGVAYTVREEAIQRTFGVEYEARYTADRKQIRVSLAM